MMLAGRQVKLTFQSNKKNILSDVKVACHVILETSEISDFDKSKG